MEISHIIFMYFVMQPLLLLLISDLSTVAALLLQFVGHVLVRCCPTAVLKDLLVGDFEQLLRPFTRAPVEAGELLGSS